MPNLHHVHKKETKSERKKIERNTITSLVLNSTFKTIINFEKSTLDHDTVKANADCE